MKQIIQWIFANPSSVKSFSLPLAAFVFKLIQETTGSGAALERWNPVVETTLDLIVYILGGLGAGLGIYHATRGPLLTSTQQTAVIVASIQQTPVHAVIPVVEKMVGQVMAAPPTHEDVPIPPGCTKF